MNQRLVNIPGDCDKAATAPSVLAYLRAVIAASECLVLETDLLRGVEAALAALRDHTQFDRVYVFRDMPRRGGLVLYAESYRTPAANLRPGVGDRLVSNHEHSKVSATVRAFKVYQSTHVQRRGPGADFNDATGSHSDLLLPIPVGGAFWGLIGFDDCKRDRSWSAAEITALQESASMIAAAVVRDSAMAARSTEVAAVVMRDRLLAAVAQSMQALLGTDGSSFDEAVHATLDALGEACGIHRVKVLMQRRAPETRELTHYLDYEWWASGLASQTSLGLTQFRNALISDIFTALQAGKALWWWIDDVPIEVRAEFSRVGVQSVGTVPVFAGGKYVGAVAFDDCVNKRVWSQAEIDALSAAARTIGSAIHRHQLQQAMLEERDHRIELKRQRAEDAEAANAQLRRRDALLDAVARMSRDLLQAGGWAEAMPAALQRLGEAAGIQRVVLFREFIGPQGQAGHRVILEWCGAGIAAHADLGIEAIPNEAAAVFVAKLHAGEAVWSHVEELGDSVRDAFRRLGIVSTGCVPIIVSGAYWGAITFDDCLRERDWDAAEIDSLSAAANAVAAAIGRQQAEDARLTSERERADALRQANDGLISSMSRLVALTDLPAFLGQLLLALTRTGAARVGWLLAFDAVDDQLWMRQCVVDGELVDVKTDPRLELWRQPVPDVAVHEWRENLAGQVLAYHSLPESAEDAAWPENLQWHRHMGHRLLLHFPLNIGGQLVGIAGVSMRANEGPVDFQLQQAVVLAQQAAIAMQMERLARLVESSAVRSERERMAAEIHDSLAQSFTSIAMQSESLAGLLTADQDKARILRLIERTAREGLAEARMSVLALLPVDNWPGSLDQSLASLAERSNIRGGIECRFESNGAPCAIPGQVQESLLRIAQEATSNAMRHSGGTRVSILLNYLYQCLHMTIEDDGHGLPLAGEQRQNGGFGVTGMENRAAAIGASWRLGRSRLGGLAVHVELPCHRAGALSK